MSKSYVIAFRDNRSDPVRYRAVRAEANSFYGLLVTPLARDANGEEETFGRYEDAEAVVWTYDAGPDQDAVRARWDSEERAWTTIEHYQGGRGHSADREDFHAD